jgi:hypothetical protein
MSVVFHLSGDHRQSDAAAILAAQAAGVNLPEAVRAAALGADTAYTAARAIDSQVHAVADATRQRLEASIWADIEQAAGRGEVLVDPFAPIRDLDARRVTLGTEAEALRRAWGHWSSKFVVAVVEDSDAIADSIESALIELCDAARPLAAKLDGLAFSDPEALYAADARAQAAFEGLRPLAARQDVLRRAAFGLHGLMRPMPGEERPDAREIWVDMAYRFAGGGVVVDEALSFAAPDPETGEKEVLDRNFQAARYAPAGHPVERLLEAVSLAPGRRQGPPGKVA